MEFEKGKPTKDRTFNLIKAYLTDAGFENVDKEVLYLAGFGSPKAGSKLTVEALHQYRDEVIIPAILDAPRELVIALGNTGICAVGVADKPEKINQYQRKRLSN